MSYSRAEDPVNVYWLAQCTLHRNQEALVIRRPGWTLDFRAGFDPVRRFLHRQDWKGFFGDTIIPFFSGNEKRIILSAMRRWIADVEEKWPKRAAMKRHRMERMGFDPLAVDETVGESLKRPAGVSSRDWRNRRNKRS